MVRRAAPRHVLNLLRGLEKRRYGAFNVTWLSRRHIDFIVRQYNQSTMGRRGMNWRALPRYLPLKYARYFRVLPPCRTGKSPSSAFGGFCFQCPLKAVRSAIKDIPSVYFKTAQQSGRGGLLRKTHCTLIVLSKL